MVLISGIDYLWLALGSAGSVLRESGGSQQNSKLTSRNKLMTHRVLDLSFLGVFRACCLKKNQVFQPPSTIRLAFPIEKRFRFAALLVG